jgi:drug/metabolite transporter (DMT)-like permease
MIPEPSIERPDRNSQAQALLSCLSYAACSTLLSLTNKAIFSDQNLNYPWSLLGLQSIVCAVVLATYYAAAIGRIPLRLSLLRELLVPCSIFTLYIYTNARALRYVSLPIFSVIKSLAPMGIAASERALFGEHMNPATYGAMALMLVANIVTVHNDIEYSRMGYMWAFGNTLANIAYVVSLRYCMSKEHKNGEKALHLNVLLSLMIPPAALASGELPDFVHDVVRTSSRFRIIFFISCVLASGIGASVFWVIKCTSGSTLSFVGAANKVVVIVLGAVLFEVHINSAGWVGIALGVLGSIAFIVSKVQNFAPCAAAEKPMQSESGASTADNALLSLDSEDSERSYYESGDDSFHSPDEKPE